MLEPVGVGSLGLKWTEAWIVGLWLQLMYCTRSVIQPWISGTDIGRRLELHNANEELMGVHKLISELTNIHVLEGFLY
jgi:hypothetical protein